MMNAITITQIINDVNIKSFVILTIVVLTLLYLLITIILFAGLIKPYSVMFWSKYPNRKNILMIWLSFTGVIVLTYVILYPIFFSEQSRYEKGKRAFQNKNFEQALDYWNNISNDYYEYSKVDSLLQIAKRKIDSIDKVLQKQKVNQLENIFYEGLDSFRKAKKYFADNKYNKANKSFSYANNLFTVFIGEFGRQKTVDSMIRVTDSLIEVTNKKDELDPMRLGRDSVESILLGKNFYELVEEEKLPIEEWGKDERLEFRGFIVPLRGSDGNVQIHSHEFMGFYYEKSNVSFVVNNLREDIIYAGFSKDSAKETVQEKLMEKMSAVMLISDRLKDGAMHDPRSFEHVKTEYKEWEGNEVVLKMTYRGKNAYGAEVQNWLKVRVNMETSKIELLAEG